MSHSPIEDLEIGRAFYASLIPELDVSHFAALWHIFTVGHLVAADLERIARRQGLSIADVLLLGTLRIERPRPLRATDLALTLNVSNAVLSARVRRLARAGLLKRMPNRADRRAFDLVLTAKGKETAEAAIVEIAASAQIVRQVRKLSDHDRETLGRILGDLHEGLDREFVATARGDI